MYFKDEPIWQKQLIRDIANRYGIDIRVVRQMVYYPFLFTKYKISSDTDKTAIRHRYLGAFVVKKRYEDYFNETNVTKNS